MTSLAQLGPAAQAQAVAQIGEQEKKRQKYGAQRTMIDGITFDSKKEATRYAELKLLERGKQISFLETQVRFPLVINGTLCATYVADFRYVRDGAVIVEDVKSTATMTPVYRIKKKLMKALRNIEILET